MWQGRLGGVQLRAFSTSGLCRSVHARRSLLYVPGSSEKMLVKVGGCADAEPDTPGGYVGVRFGGQVGATANPVSLATAKGLHREWYSKPCRQRRLRRRS